MSVNTRLVCLFLIYSLLIFTSMQCVDSADAGWHKAGTFTTTSYCSCAKCCGVWSGTQQRTRGGTIPRFGTIAADWKVLPKNSVVKLQGLKEFTFLVEDTGSAIQGRRIDLYLPNHEQARRWGRRQLKVWVWEPDDTDRGIIAGLSDIGGGVVKAASGLLDLVWPF